MKVARKANIYLSSKDKNQTSTYNLWGGGLLTAVNEDNEVVFYVSVIYLICMSA